MKAIYLKFPSESEANKLLMSLYEDESLKDPVNFAVDVIGTIYDISGDSDNPKVTPLEGFHVNMLCPDDFKDFSEYEVTPKSPRRIFGGWK